MAEPVVTPAAPAAPSTAPSPAREPVTPESIGAAADPWAGLEPEIRQGTVDAKKWAGPADAARAYHAAQRLLGKPADELVHVPKAGLTPEMRSSLKARILGTPEKPDAYDFGEITDPEGAPQLLGWWRGVAHKLGLGQEEAREAAEAWTAFGAEQIAQQEEKSASARQTAAASLQTKHGAAFDSMREAGARALAALGITQPDSAESSELELMLEQAMGPAAFFETFAELGKKLGEHKLVEGKSSPAGGLDAMQAEIATITNDRAGAYWSKEHPGHKAAVERVQELMAKIHGDAPAWGPGSGGPE